MVVKMHRTQKLLKQETSPEDLFLERKHKRIKKL